MKNKNKAKVKRHIKNKKVCMFAIFFVFPIIVGLIYCIPVPQIIYIDSGDLLMYYATVFGIAGSFTIYRWEVNLKEKEKIRNLKPSFVVEVNLYDENKKIFNISITNCSKQRISFLYFYDEFVSEIIQEKYIFRVVYNKTKEKFKAIDAKYNIELEPDFLDKDGYPEYIQLLCDDKEGNTWDCSYYKVKDCNRIYYYPRDFEIAE